MENNLEESKIRALYNQLLNAWNNRNGTAFATLYEENGSQIGFDGSQVNGRIEIESNMNRIFADHVTAAYISIVREVRFPNQETAILRAVAGMVPAGQKDINPAAAFHGRPEAVQELTTELRQYHSTQK